MKDRRVGINPKVQQWSVDILICVSFIVGSMVGAAVTLGLTS